VTRAPGRTEEQWWNESLAEQAWQRHLLQAGFADKLVGRFVDRLHKTGLWDKALVIVTVDEGDSFRGGDSRRDPTKTNLGDIAFIPLFVRLPGKEDGGVVERHVTSVDVLPTIASVLGVKIKWRVDGRSVLTSGPGPRTVRVGTFSSSFRTAQALRQRARERKLSLFGSGSWGPKLSATGRYWELVGKHVSSAQRAGALSARATVDGVGTRLLRKLPKRSQLIPSPLAGTISGLRPGDTLAFALNGRIAAVSQVYRERDTGALRFSALPAASAFAPGRNRLRAFVVTGPVAAPALREMRLSLSR
jgi:hypothetical protein